MLVQFMLKNVLSFKEETTLDLTAINAYKEHPCNLIDIGFPEKYLKTAAIYGANASGKSNLYFAMSFFQNIIRESLNNTEGEKESVLSKCYRPFLLDKEKNENSEFQITGISDNYEYRYGFEYNAKCIVSEWLYRKNLETNRTSVILERTADSVAFGATVRRECELYKKQIPEDALALSFFYRLRLKTDVFQNVYSEIMAILVMQTDFYENTKILEYFLPRILERDKQKFLEFLTAIDSGIRDITYEEDEKKIIFLTYHKGRDGEIYPLNLCDESEGTVKSIAIFIYVQLAILNNRAIFVDELNVKLHPLLLKFIIDLFYAENSKAQLIYTTHDTTLMDKKFFRRDQIWFVQKDEYGCSELTALSDYKVRSDASFEKDYLAGVYGGIPFLKEFQMKDGE